ncbi:MAG: hypothetical protein JWO32_1260 [Bacteroidetes bacterium]|nr:hypothetical protein [Bacteroidota bacterium]
MNVYAIPGLATNHNIFRNIHLNDHELIVLKWPPLKKEYSLQDYAACFLDQIKDTEPFVLLGLSFGGMLAVELGKLCHPEKVILISTAKNREGLSWFLRVFKYLPLHLIIPEFFFRKFSYTFRRIIGALNSDLALLAPMVKDMPFNYFKNAIKYIVNWNNKDIPDNCILIHGTHDRLLRFNKKYVDHEIKKGTHAMIINRAEELNKLLNLIINN